MFEYRCIRIGRFEQHTEDILNQHAKEGWRVICGYYQGGYLILEREVE